MKLVDANVLLYAVNEDAPRHTDAHNWLDNSLKGREAIGFAWIVLLAFIRLVTKVGLFPHPLSVSAALDTTRDWISQPPGILVEPTPRHLDVMAGLLSLTGSGGNLVNDAHLAALALEYDADIVTYDSDYGRFAGVRWHSPLD